MTEKKDTFNNTFLENSPFPTLVVDLSDESILFKNKIADKFLQEDASEIPETLSELFLNTEEVSEIINTLKKGIIIESHEARIKKSNGHLFDILLSANRAVYKDTETAIVSFIDISDRKRAEKQLTEIHRFLEESIDRSNQKVEEMSYRDSFTGLPNREMLNRDLKLQLPAYTFVINVDSFHEIISAYGFNASNAVLMHLAQTLSDLTSEIEGTLYRSGDDEFAYCIREGKNFDHFNFANHIIKAVRENAPTYEDITIQISVCIGIVINEKENIMQKAAIAITQAKAKGHGKIKTYIENPAVTKKYKDNIIWASRISEALENNTIVPFFQGIRNNITGEINKYECLARIHIGKDFISPSYFLTSAKHSGLTSAITGRMIETCFEYMQDKTCEFSINLCEDDFQTNTMFIFLRKMLTKTGIDPSRITFEILENFSIMKHNTYMLERLHELKDMGFKLAIDDFGTDFSNFARLLDIPADYIKIDGSFIKDIAQRKDCYKIVKAITDFAHSIECEVIAEFVHNKEVQMKVFQLGIEYSQGYYFSCPGRYIPPSENIEEQQIS
jgi:diguanylate cyclase (GGDEF)-like protein